MVLLDPGGGGAEAGATGERGGAKPPPATRGGWAKPADGVRREKTVQPAWSAHSPRSPFFVGPARQEPRKRQTEVA